MQTKLVVVLKGEKEMDSLALLTRQKRYDTLLRIQKHSIENNEFFRWFAENL